MKITKTEFIKVYTGIIYQYKNITLYDISSYITLDVKDLCNKVHKVICTQYTSIANIKKSISDKIDIPATEIKCIWQTRYLKDNHKTVGEYGITQDNNTIHITL